MTIRVVQLYKQTVWHQWNHTELIGNDIFYVSCCDQPMIMSPTTFSSPLSFRVLPPLLPPILFPLPFILLSPVMFLQSGILLKHQFFFFPFAQQLATLTENCWLKLNFLKYKSTKLMQPNTSSYKEKKTGHTTKFFLK